MYIAEIKGKLPTQLSRSEDILTSNVFSFLKYADRRVYLKSFLSQLGITLSNEELEEAEFVFWPSFDDYTEPDVVIIVGNYYILFEAKYLSGFGQETEDHKSQLIREIEGGMLEAKSLGKEFLLVAITADYYYIKEKYLEVTIKPACNFKWINWQAVSRILLRLIESEGLQLPNYSFALDLYNLLEKKDLRDFRSFLEIKTDCSLPEQEELFFSAKTARYRGSFIGFCTILNELQYINKVDKCLFFKRTYFKQVAGDIKTPDILFFEG
ncbi:MAG: hypothetical protein PHI24_10470 [Desulfitobacteriaceae bacterium]|nr:hypothetical protein [Desulfitobacteriaceae bacterium]